MWIMISLTPQRLGEGSIRQTAAPTGHPDDASWASWVLEEVRIGPVAGHVRVPVAMRH